VALTDSTGKIKGQGRLAKKKRSSRKKEEEDALAHLQVGPTCEFAACSFGLSATSQQYFSLRTNQPSATSQQYFSLRANQHQPPATSQPNRLLSI
jgi:hypothetical protein